MAFSDKAGSEEGGLSLRQNLLQIEWRCPHCLGERNEFVTPCYSDSADLAYRAGLPEMASRATLTVVASIVLTEFAVFGV